MLVRDRMTAQPLVVVTPSVPVIEAQRLMQEHDLRHLPVVADETARAGGGARLVGLLSRETMLRAIVPVLGPWSAAGGSGTSLPAGSLSTLESQYLLSKIKVDKIMLRDVITVAEDVAVEEAARIMVDRRIGCLPVVGSLPEHDSGPGETDGGGRLIGIITDIDLLATTMEMLGARRPGLRLSVLVPYRVGEIARVAREVAEIGGNVTAFGTWEAAAGGPARARPRDKPVPSPEAGAPERFGMVLRVDGVSQEALITAVRELHDVEIVDVREMGRPSTAGARPSDKPLAPSPLQQAPKRPGPLSGDQWEQES